MSARIIPSDFVRRSVELSASRGIDLRPAVVAAHIDRTSLADPLTRLTPAQVTAFVQEVWRLTDDELFGLGSAPVPRGTFRLLCLSLIHCPDLESVVNRLADVGRALPSLPRLRVDPGAVGTTVTIVPNEAHQQLPEEALRITTDFTLILLHRFAAWLVGKRVKLLSVHAPYPTPVRELAQNYDHIFGVPVTFDSAMAALEFDNAALRLPVIQTEEALEEYLRGSPNLLLSERDYDSAASAQVRRALELGVKGRTATAEDIADMLSISVPHLRRLLRQDGTSFNLLREEVLRDTAIAGLHRGESVEVLSARLGFSEPSAFRRAFKRWTGSTPSSYR